MKARDGLPIIECKTQSDWEKWLVKNHDTQDGVWIRYYKKTSGIKTITHPEAIDEALCYGWIDGQGLSYDEKSYLQRFTPRRKRSIWSKINIANVERLTKEGRMKPSGLAQVEAAKADGRWAKAYDSPANMEIPKDLLAALSKNKKAETFFKTLNKSNLYAITWRLQTAKKEETRQNRMKLILEMLAKEQRFH